MVILMVLRVLISSAVGTYRQAANLQAANLQAANLQAANLQAGCLKTHCLHAQGLHKEDVVHFDLKCDNILLAVRDGTTDTELFEPATDRLPCDLILADFGESCDFKLSDSHFSTR